jgi:hypothetical protein
MSSPTYLGGRLPIGGGLFLFAPVDPSLCSGFRPSASLRAGSAGSRWPPSARLRKPRLNASSCRQNQNPLLSVKPISSEVLRTAPRNRHARSPVPHRWRRVPVRLGRRARLDRHHRRPQGRIRSLGLRLLAHSRGLRPPDGTMKRRASIDAIAKPTANDLRDRLASIVVITSLLISEQH